MTNSSQTRRRILTLAMISVPALAAGVWMGPGKRRATWIADGQLRFFSEPDGIHWASADSVRSGLFLPLGVNFALTPGSIAPCSSYLAYSALDRRTGSNIWTVPIYLRDGRPIAGKPAEFFHSGAFDVNPRFTGDGQSIAYASREAGKWKVQVRRFI